MRSVIILTWIMLVIIGLSVAQVPQLINYQGRLTDDTGQAVEDGTYQIVFTIYDAEDAETGIWYSGIQDILVINGLFNYQLGSTNPLPPSIFADSSRWLGIRVIGDGDPEITPRTRLVSSPYAFKAYKAEYTGYAESADVANRLYACAGIEHLTTQVWTPPPASLNANEIKLIFPKTFDNIENLQVSLSVVVTTGTCAGYPGRVESVTIANNYAIIALRGWNGSSWVDLSSGDEVDVSYFIFEE